MATISFCRLDNFVAEGEYIGAIVRSRPDGFASFCARCQCYLQEPPWLLCGFLPRALPGRRNECVGMDWPVCRAFCNVQGCREQFDREANVRQWRFSRILNRA